MDVATCTCIGATAVCCVMCMSWSYDKFNVIFIQCDTQLFSSIQKCSLLFFRFLVVLIVTKDRFCAFSVNCFLFISITVMRWIWILISFGLFPPSFSPIRIQKNALCVLCFLLFSGGKVKTQIPNKVVVMESNFWRFYFVKVICCFGVGLRVVRRGKIK